MFNEYEITVPPSVRDVRSHPDPSSHRSPSFFTHLNDTLGFSPPMVRIGPQSDPTRPFTRTSSTTVISCLVPHFPPLSERSTFYVGYVSTSVSVPLLSCHVQPRYPDLPFVSDSVLPPFTPLLHPSRGPWFSGRIVPSLTLERKSRHSLVLSRNF